MSWSTATVKGLLVFLYFVVTTVWLPDFLMGLSVISDASSLVRDLVLLVVWGVALGGGLYLLREAQRRALI